ncbi:MAG TPA: phage tail protein [Candidatus Saccharimonadales bacterium]|nr:phage tail protein [Candidatus Saccharimonadales bacterium]
MAADQTPVTWRNIPGAQANWAVRTTGNTTNNLMQWGDIQFQVQPLNFDQMDHDTATDYAHKEIAGAAIYREWVGENDELIYLRGKLFPYRIGGVADIEKFDAYRRQGFANVLMRGDGRTMGWFVCEKLTRNHSYISFEGLGQQIAFEAVLARVPVPDADSYLSTMWIAGGP